MEWKQWFLEVMRALAWPATVLTLGLIFRRQLVAIADQIAKLIPRTTEASPTGFKFGDAAARQDAAPAVGPGEAVKPLDIPPATRMIGVIEKRILSDLTVVDSGKRVEVLTRLLAQARLMASHERVFAAIFGSQLNVLQRLAREGALSAAVVRDYYQLVQSTFGDAHRDRPFEMWIGYLARQQLLTLTEERIEITDLGRDFLDYIAAAYPGVFRPG